MTKGIVNWVLPCLLVAFSVPAQAGEIDDLKRRIDDLEAKMAKSDARQKRKLNSLQEDLKEAQQKLRISGFATAGVTKSDSTFSTSDREFTEEFNYSSDTKAAVQLDYRMDEHWSATVQVMGRAYDEWDAEVEWAFVKYKYNEQLAFRAGRLRLPFYYYSESLDVGFVYPWVRPPMPFYVTSISNYEGLDANYRFATGDFTHEASAFVGATKGTLPNGLSIDLEDLWGATYAINYYSLGFRLSAMTSDADLDFGGAFGLNNVSDRVGYYSAALIYSGENLFLLAEASRSDTEMVIIRTSEAAQATVGYKWNRWMPYATYATSRSMDNDDAKLLGGAVLPPAEADNSSFGVVLEASTQVNIKFQFDHFYNLGGGNPNFSGLKEGTDVYTINVNTIF